MIGEATLAMLYVPLFYYLFDRLAQRKKDKLLPETAPSVEEPPDDAGEGGDRHA